MHYFKLLCIAITVSGTSLYAMKKPQLRFEREMGVHMMIVNLSSTPYGFSIEGARDPKTQRSKILGQIVVESKQAQPFFIKEIQLSDLENNKMLKIKALALKDRSFDPSQLTTQQYNYTVKNTWDRFKSRAIVILPTKKLLDAPLMPEVILTPLNQGKTDMMPPEVEIDEDYKSTLLTPFGLREDL